MNPLAEFPVSLRRLLARVVGRGPSGVVKPFAWHARRQHENQRQGLIENERLTGVIARWPGESFLYQPLSLLRTDGGIEHPTRLHPPAAPRGLAPAIDFTLHALAPGAVLGDGCLVYCPETRVTVEESLKRWNEPIRCHPGLAAPRFPAPTHLPGIGLVVGALGVQSFYHLLLEALPKISLARPWLDQIDHFIINAPPGGFIEKWLLAAGLPAERLRWLSPLSQFTCDQLLFFGMLTRHHHVTPPILREVRALWPRATSPGGRRLWISRRKNTVRNLRWEDDILRRFPRLERVAMEDLGPLEQVELMRSAELIAGPHGAGLAGMVFAAPGTRVVEFGEAKEPAPNGCFARLAQVSGLKHLLVHADFDQPMELEWLSPLLD